MADDLLTLMRQWLEQLEQQGSMLKGMDPCHLWPEASASLPPQQAELVALLTRQSIEFTRFAQQIIVLLETGSAETGLNELLDRFQEHLRTLTQEWILQRWQLPEQLGALFHTHSFQDDLLLDNPFVHGLKSLLDTPSRLGLQQALQQQLRVAVDRLLEYEQALRDYSAHYSAINTAASADFLAAIEASSPPIRSIGQLHDLWVESYESRYSKTIATDGYRDAHGRISNAVTALRQWLQEWRDGLLSQLGIPNGRQLERIHQRLHEQRRQIKALKREIGELQQLRSEVEQLKGALSRREWPARQGTDKAE